MHDEGLDLSGSSGDDGGLGIVPVAVTLHDPGPDGKHVFQGSCDLNPNNVLLGVDSEKFVGEGFLDKFCGLGRKIRGKRI